MSPSDALFLRTGTVDVDAAIIGIGRSRWISADPEHTEADAAQVMSQHRFDILPIDPGPEKPIYEYFHTQQWNHWHPGTIRKAQITYRDILPTTTPPLDLLEKLVQSERDFFFLTHENRIVGLLTVANLNCRQVRFFLFALICEFESRLAKLVRQKLDEEAVVTILEDKAKAAYESDREQGFENDAVHYLYLRDLLNLTRTHHLFQSLGYPSKTQFEKLNTLNDLRNDVMHSVRSLVSDRASLNKLWERIDKLQDALFRLRQLQGL